MLFSDSTLTNFSHGLSKRILKKETQNSFKNLHQSAVTAVEV